MVEWLRALGQVGQGSGRQVVPTSTLWPSASSRSTRVDPMKPAPPVTTVFTPPRPGAGPPAKASPSATTPPAHRSPTALDPSPSSTSHRAPSMEPRTLALATDPGAGEDQRAVHHRILADDRPGFDHRVDRPWPADATLAPAAMPPPSRSAIARLTDRYVGRGTGIDPIGVRRHGVEPALFDEGGKVPARWRPVARPGPARAHWLDT